MKLIETIKRVVKNRKKKRVAKNPRVISANMTLAERLILNNWGIKFTYKSAAGKGVALAAKREATQRKRGKIVQNPKKSRQVLRAEDRRMWKRLRSEMKEQQAKRAKRGTGTVAQ